MSDATNTTKENIAAPFSTQEIAFARALIARLHLHWPQERAESCSPHEVAERIYGARRLRTAFFSEGLFADPAWDMLLALYCSWSKGQEESVTSVVYASGVPSTTGLRWLQSLEKHGFVAKNPHATDRRRVIVSLTEEGRRRVEGYLKRAGEKHFRFIVPSQAA